MFISTSLQIRSGNGVGLIKFPNPNTEDTINIILNTNDINELRAASTFLYKQEIQKSEFREKLLDRLEENISNLNTERFDIIYKGAGLADSGNKRETLNVPKEKVQSDYEYYLHLAKRANDLRNKINSPSNI